MNNGISIWNGYPVHGDIEELDRIVESEGFINLDKDDVITVLSAKFRQSQCGNCSFLNSLKSLKNPSLCQPKLKVNTLLDESLGDSYKVVLVASVKA